MGLLALIILSVGFIIAVTGRMKKDYMMWGGGCGIMLAVVALSLFLLLPAEFVKGVGCILVCMGSIILGQAAGDVGRRKAKKDLTPST